MAVETEEDMVANVGGCGREVAAGQNSRTSASGEDDGGMDGLEQRPTAKSARWHHPHVERLNRSPDPDPVYSSP